MLKVPVAAQQVLKLALVLKLPEWLHMTGRLHLWIWKSLAQTTLRACKGMKEEFRICTN